jgi:hypothetical protein
MIRKSESRVLTEIRSTRVAAPDATTASPHLHGKVKVTVAIVILSRDRRSACRIMAQIAQQR